MSFLDSLENNLKNLESGAAEEDTSRERDRKTRDAAAERLIAPWAERLRKDAFTAKLMSSATQEGFRRKTKVYIVWLGSMLRLEARERRLEMRPATDGVQAVFLLNGEETASRLIKLDGDPAELVREWLA